MSNKTIVRIHINRMNKKKNVEEITHEHFYCENISPGFRLNVNVNIITL
jgi:hypothetical protein